MMHLRVDGRLVFGSNDHHVYEFQLPS